MQHQKIVLMVAISCLLFTLPSQGMIRTLPFQCAKTAFLQKATSPFALHMLKNRGAHQAPVGPIRTQLPNIAVPKIGIATALALGGITIASARCVPGDHKNPEKKIMPEASLKREYSEKEKILVQLLENFITDHLNENLSTYRAYPQYKENSDKERSLYLDLYSSPEYTMPDTIFEKLTASPHGMENLCLAIDTNPSIAKNILPEITAERFTILVQKTMCGIHLLHRLTTLCQEGAQTFANFIHSEDIGYLFRYENNQGYDFLKAMIKQNQKSANAMTNALQESTINILIKTGWGTQFLSDLMESSIENARTMMSVMTLSNCAILFKFMGDSDTCTAEQLMQRDPEIARNLTNAITSQQMKTLFNQHSGTLLLLSIIRSDTRNAKKLAHLLTPDDLDTLLDTALGPYFLTELTQADGESAHIIASLIQPQHIAQFLVSNQPSLTLMVKTDCIHAQKIIMQKINDTITTEQILTFCNDKYGTDVLSWLKEYCPQTKDTMTAIIASNSFETFYTKSGCTFLNWIAENDANSTDTMASAITFKDIVAILTCNGGITFLTNLIKSTHNAEKITDKLTPEQLITLLNSGHGQDFLGELIQISPQNAEKINSLLTPESKKQLSNNWSARLFLSKLSFAINA